MKLLCIADVHLGRFPARLHGDLYGRAAELGPAAAWWRAVELAVNERVDAVLLAGDLVDGGKDFFEAFGDLRSGAQRLADAGIAVLAVSGNHDVDVLPKLVEAVPGVRLLGAGGRWEAADVVSDAGSVRVFGWSFPSRRVERSPIAAGFPSSEASDAPLAVIGLLHADRDQVASPYAPVTSAELAAAPVDAWLLGHVHQPDFGPAAAGGPRFTGYLGSLTSNDPGEAGARGAWLLEVAPAGKLSARHVPLAPLRWERVVVDVSSLESADRLPNLIVSALEELDARLTSEGASSVAVGCRLTLTGRTPLRARLEQQLASDPPSGSLLKFGERTYFVDRVKSEALPALDLHALARKDDPVGLLAARIVALREPAAPLRARLVAAARPRLEEVGRSRAFSGSARPPLQDHEIAELLEEAALRALDALMAQNPARHEAGDQVPA